MTEETVVSTEATATPTEAVTQPQAEATQPAQPTTSDLENLLKSSTEGMKDDLAKTLQDGMAKFKADMESEQKAKENKVEIDNYMNEARNKYSLKTDDDIKNQVAKGMSKLNLSNDSMLQLADSIGHAKALDMVFMAANIGTPDASVLSGKANNATMTTNEINAQMNKLARDPEFRKHVMDTSEPEHFQKMVDLMGAKMASLGIK